VVTAAETMLTPAAAPGLLSKLMACVRLEFWGSTLGPDTGVSCREGVGLTVADAGFVRGAMVECRV
jgi:hypothetical protein